MLTLLYWLDLLGVAVFALSGVLSAKTMKLDLFGVAVVAIITAIGGGTVRDLLLGRTPVFWMQDETYLLIALATAIISFYILRHRDPESRILLTFDALGLAVFTVIGVDVARSVGVSPLISVLMGVMTGTFGGIIRDLLFNRIPVVLHRDIYATAALIGALVDVLLTMLALNPNLVIGLGVATTFSVRMLSVRHRWSLPTMD
jgi:uncharacterized membrane protein YeiH